MKTNDITADQAYSTTKEMITNPLMTPRYKRVYNIFDAGVASKRRSAEAAKAPEEHARMML